MLILIFLKNENGKNQYEKTFKKRCESIQENHLVNVFFQLINENTRNENFLDHIYSNNINKINKSYIEIDSCSDHRFIIVEK